MIDIHGELPQFTLGYSPDEIPFKQGEINENHRWRWHSIARLSTIKSWKHRWTQWNTGGNTEKSMRPAKLRNERCTFPKPDTSQGRIKPSTQADQFFHPKVCICVHWPTLFAGVWSIHAVLQGHWPAGLSATSPFWSSFSHLLSLEIKKLLLGWNLVPLKWQSCSIFCCLTMHFSEFTWVRNSVRKLAVCHGFFPRQIAAFCVMLPFLVGFPDFAQQTSWDQLETNNSFHVGFFCPCLPLSFWNAAAFPKIWLLHCVRWAAGRNWGTSNHPSHSTSLGSPWWLGDPPF